MEINHKKHEPVALNTLWTDTLYMVTYYKPSEAELKEFNHVLTKVREMLERLEKPEPLKM